MSSHQSNRNNNFKKRKPAKNFTRSNDVYITNKTNIAAQLNKCIEMLNSETGEIFIHSIGNSINRSINLALILEEKHKYKYEVNTSTINLIDDKFPIDDDDDDFLVRKRLNSCIHIRVYRPFLLANEEHNKEQERMIKI